MTDPGMTFRVWLDAFAEAADEAVWNAYGADEKRLEKLWADGLSPGDAAELLAAELADEDDT